MNCKADICCIGHITLDKVVTPEFEAFMPGGTAYYFAKALKNLNHEGFKLVTSLGEKEYKVVDELRADGIDVEVIPSRESVFFENRYGSNLNDRTQRVLAKADPFLPEKLEGLQAKTFHLGTLLADDFSLESVKMLAEKGEVSVDIQGFLRKVVGEDVVHIDCSFKHEMMKYITTLKANEKEMEVLTGEKDPYRAAAILAEWGCRDVVLTLGDRGSLIYANGEYYEIPAIKAGRIVDATGCGDTYMAGYLNKRSRGASYREAGLFAAAMCTLKLANKGPFEWNEEEVKKLMLNVEC